MQILLIIGYVYRRHRGPGKWRAKTLVWFGEIERKLAKLSMTFTYRSSSYLFYDGR
jgi:hypothetical protein